MTPPRPRLELAEIVREHAANYLTRYPASTAQHRVLRAVVRCRTAALGGHVEECDHCGQQRIAYNSCRNRHCPKCQAPAAAEWLQARAQELLPVPYFHVVFTLPECLGPLALQNPRVVYGLLFQAVAETLSEVAANPKHLGARLGFLAVLHTWGQNLMHHPHVHCVVPGGGLSAAGRRWIRNRHGSRFFLPVRILSRVFRGKFVAGLKRAFRRGELGFHGRLRSLAHATRFESLLTQSVRHDWVVYAKRPFGTPAAVLHYLAQYTHRVAISNARLLSCQEGRVAFRYKDYAAGGQPKTMTLDAVEFLRRFLLHVLPSGFQKIRHFGWMANRDRTANLQRCRQLLAPRSIEPALAPLAMPTAIVEHSVQVAAGRCPECRQGRLLVILRLAPQPTHHLAVHTATPGHEDTS